MRSNLNLASDIDDTKYEFVEPFLEWYNMNNGTCYYPEQMAHYDFSRCFGWDRQYTLDVLSRFYNTVEFMRVHILDGAAECLRRLARDGAKLYDITSRPDFLHDKTTSRVMADFGDIMEPDSILFSSNHNSGCGHSTKAELCGEFGIGVLLEDCATYAIEVATHEGCKTQVVLLDMPWNQVLHLPRRVVRVSSWKDAGEFLDAGF